MKELVSMLDDYRRRWPEESETVRRFLDFVSSNPNCFDRDLKIGHVTGSAWVVDQGGTHVLLTHHRKLDRWLQLGGHADGSADVLGVALREVKEESGLESVAALSTEIFDIDIHRIAAREKMPEHFHYDVRFAVEAKGDEGYVVSDESHDLAWIEISSIESVTDDESILRMARKWLEPPARHVIPFTLGNKEHSMAIAFFDLDGTISDPAEGITRSINHALIGLGYQPRPTEALLKYIGPHLYTTFSELTGRSDEKTLSRGVELYRERYIPIGFKENRFPSIAVRWGYGPEEELEMASAIVETPQALLAAVQRITQRAGDLNSQWCSDER